MTKPDLTLQPSKAVLTGVAAQIYAAYVNAGFLEKTESPDQWIKRSIREAIGIARAVDASVQSDSELPTEQTQSIGQPIDQPVVEDLHDE